MREAIYDRVCQSETIILKHNLADNLNQAD